LLKDFDAQKINRIPKEEIIKEIGKIVENIKLINKK
jgi:hypothetical protein